MEIQLPKGCGMEAKSPLKACELGLRRTCSGQPGRKLTGTTQADSPNKKIK